MKLFRDLLLTPRKFLLVFCSLWFVRPSLPRTNSPSLPFQAAAAAETLMRIPSWAPKGSFSYGEDLTVITQQWLYKIKALWWKSKNANRTQNLCDALISKDRFLSQINIKIVCVTKLNINIISLISSPDWVVVLVRVLHEAGYFRPRI